MAAQMYYLALVLPEELNGPILEYKQLMLQRFGCRVGLKSPAHITIAPPYWMEKDLEEDLLREVDGFCSGVGPFVVRTEGFSAFKPRTIFVDVLVDEPLAGFKKRADAFFRSIPRYGLKVESRPFHPHITIATRDMAKSVFAEAWPLFKDLEHRVSWEATGLSVLRHNQKNWDVIHTSQFQNR